MTPKDLLRFWSKVDQGKPDECWLWQGLTSEKGYGRFSVGGRTVKAHRFAFEAVNGPIPAGMQIRHRCDTPGCCNPEHLELGLPIHNARDRVRRGRQHDCSGANNGNAKLTPEQVQQARQLKGTLSVRKAATQLGISKSNLHQIWKGERWTGLQEGPNA